MKNYVKGLFIAIEGADGVGKSTQAKMLAKTIKNMGYPVLLTGEPTNSWIGNLIRDFLRHDVGGVSPEVVARVEALLFAADRELHLGREVLPALSKGMVVISDRYKLSSMVYQTLNGADPRWVEELNRFAPEPHLTILIDLPPDQSFLRLEGKRCSHLDKFERREYQARVREKYLRLAGDRVAVVSGSGSPMEVHERVLALVKPLLNELVTPKKGSETDEQV